MKTLYRYVVYIDDASRLSGYSEQTFFGTSALLNSDEDVLHIKGEGDEHHKINWSRVRWYSCDLVQDNEPTP